MEYINTLDDLFGPQDETMTSPSSFLTDEGDGGRYPSPLYLNGSPYVTFVGKNGKQDVVKLEDGTLLMNPRGFYYKVKSMPKDLQDVIEILVAEKQGAYYAIRHANGDVNEYFALFDPTYYVLAHGTPNKNKVVGDVSAQLGIVAGEWSSYDDTTHEIARYNNVSFLCVVREFAEAGYLDESGMPKPVCIRATSITSSELWDALRAHSVVLKAAAADKVEPLKTRMVQYWAYKNPFMAGADPVKHNSKAKGQGTDAYPIVSKHPTEPEKMTGASAYASSLYCGDDLFRMLFPFVYEKVDGKVVPGGVAIEWCREECKRIAKNIAEFTGPNGERPAMGKNPPPTWYKLRGEMAEAAYLNSSAIQRQNEQASQAAQPDRIQEIISAILKEKKFFGMKNDKHGRDMCIEALDFAENPLGLSSSELFAELQQRLDTIVAYRKSITAV